MDIGRSWRPLIAVVVVSIVACGLAWVFITRTDTVVRAPGVVYPVRYADLTSPVSLGRVVDVFKNMGDNVTAGEPILTLDAENDKLLLEAVQKQIVGLKEVIKEHARAIEVEAILNKQAIELAKAAEQEAIAAIDVQKGLKSVSEAELKRAGPEAANLEINIATKLVELAKKNEEQTKAVWEDYKKLLENKATNEFEVRKAQFEHEKAQTLTLQANEQLNLLKSAEIPFKKEEATAKIAQYEGAIKTAQQVVAVKKEMIRAAELKTIVDEKGKELAVQLDHLQSEEKRIDHLIKDKVLKAPASGILTEFRIHPGQWISDKAALGTIYDTSTLIIYAHVQQKDFGRVKVGQDAKVTFDGLAREEGSVPAKVLALEALATPPLQDKIEPTAIFQEPLKGAWVPRALVKLELVDSPLNKKLHVGFTGAVKVLVQPDHPWAKYFF